MKIELSRTREAGHTVQTAWGTCLCMKTFSGEKHVKRPGGRGREI
jgi:hypothetical protein